MSAGWTSEVAWRRGDLTAWWRDELGVKVEARFESEPQSVCGLEGPGVLVVYRCAEVGESNAVVLHLDGSERGRVALPRRFHLSCFDQAYWGGGQLHLYVNAAGTTWRCSLDEQTLECQDIEYAPHS